MSKKIIKIVNNSEENANIFCNDVFVSNLNHDDHGWEGMNIGIEIVKKIAEILDIEVTEVQK